MKTVTVHEAKTHLSQLLADIEKTGEGVIICRRDTPVASLIPHKRAVRSDPHPLMRDVGIEYDPTAPLSSDEWPEDDG